MRDTCRKTLSFLVFFSFLLAIFALPLFAQDTSTQSAAIQQVNYSFPYPGILPDNPLYIFKAMRDRIISWFISDPKSKASFDLLQADKRVASAFDLSKQQPLESQLIIQTVSKGENYFSEAVGQVSIAKNQGVDVNGLLDQMDNAAKKHIQVITGMETALSGKDSEQLQLEANRVMTFDKQVMQLRHRH